MYLILFLLLLISCSHQKTQTTEDDYFWSTHLQWSYLENLDRNNTVYMSTYYPVLYGSDKEEGIQTNTSVVSQIDYSSYWDIGYYLYSLNYYIQPTGYVYAVFYYEEHINSFPQNTSSWGDYFSVFLKWKSNQTLSTTLKIEAQSEFQGIKGTSYWILNLDENYSNWTVVNLRREDATATSQIVDWENLASINFVLKDEGFGNLDIALLSFSQNKTEWNLDILPFHYIGGPDRTIKYDNFYDDFSTGYLDPNNWKIGKRYWGGCIDGYICDEPGSGGVVPENVMLQRRIISRSDPLLANTTSSKTSDFYLRLEVHGNHYNGSLYGIYPNGTRRTDEEGKKRVGAMIATNNYYASGRYEVRAKLTRFSAPGGGGGVVNAFWTFHYEESSEANPMFECLPVGCTYRKNLNLSTYYARNHEIDIEIPGRYDDGSLNGISFNKSLFNYWQGENGNGHGYHPYKLWKGEPFDNSSLCNCADDISVEGFDEYKSHHVTHSSDLRYGGELGPDGLDGWHLFRIDWHTNDTNGLRSAQYYVDGELLLNSTSSDPIYDRPGDSTSGTSSDFYLPFFAGRFTIGGWFPYGSSPYNSTYSIPIHWAGEPEFDIDCILIDYVKITPFGENNDTVPRESYPEVGWASTSEYPIKLSPPVTSSKLTTSEMTTYRITTHEITTNQVTSHSITTNSITSQSLSTMSITTQHLTTIPLTTQPLTTNSITSLSLSTMSITTQPLTTNTNGLTTQSYTTQSITTEPVTTQLMTTSSLTTQPISTELISTPTSTHVSSLPFTTGFDQTNTIEYFFSVSLEGNLDPFLSNLTYYTNLISNMIYVNLYYSTARDQVVDVVRFTGIKAHNSSFLLLSFDSFIDSSISKDKVIDSASKLKGITIGGVSILSIETTIEKQEESKSYRSSKSDHNILIIALSVVFVVLCVVVATVIFVIVRKRRNRRISDLS